MGRGLLVVTVGALAGCGRVGFDRAIDRDGAVADVAVAPLDAPRDAPPDAPPVPIVFVQSALDEGTSGPSDTVTFDADVTAGDVLIVAFDWGGQPVSTPAMITDSLGSTFAIVVGPASPTEADFIAYGVLTASGPDSVTATLASTPDFIELRAHELSGLATTNTFDVGVAIAGTAGGPQDVLTPFVTTSSSNELIFGFEDSDGSALAGAAFTTISTLDADVCEIAIAPSPGMYRADAMLTSGDQWEIEVATFRGK